MSKKVKGPMMLSVRAYIFIGTVRLLNGSWYTCVIDSIAKQYSDFSVCSFLETIEADKPWQGQNGININPRSSMSKTS